MINKKFLIYIFCVSCIWAQSQPQQVQKLLPQVLPTSPEAMAIARYGKYTVNLFTGVPEISIPIYEIKMGGISVPITLSYHAAGIKVSDIPTRVGSGWSLFAGGTITRTVKGGGPDEIAGNYFSCTPNSYNGVRTGTNLETTDQQGLDYIQRVDKHLNDVEPDIFSYDFPGHSGKFLFSQQNNFTPFLIPFSPIQVSKTQVGANINLAITDESGDMYKFNTQEWGYGINGLSSASSAWLLDSIITANGQENIHFIYSVKSGNGSTDSYFSEYEVVNDNVQSGSINVYSSDVGNIYSTISGATTVWQQLNEIDFPGGKIVFDAAPESRGDFNGLFDIQHRLADIKIYSYDALYNTYSLLKTFTLFHSYFSNGVDNTANRLKLDSIQIAGSDNLLVQSYKFTYNTSLNLPVNTSTQKDWWGYFNNNSNTVFYGTPNARPSLLPKKQIVYNQDNSLPQTTIWIGGNDTNARVPNPAYMQADILQQITFPTGGYTQFTYETNQYKDGNGNPQYAGGLRIKTIKSYDGSGGAPIVKTYVYGVNESGYGRANFNMGNYYFENHQPCRWVGEPCSTHTPTKTTSTYFSNPTNDLEGLDGSPVVYQTVTEYIGDQSANNGKTVFQFKDVSDANTSIIGYGKPYFDSYHFIRGLLTNKSVFKINSAVSTIISEERMKYQFFPYQWSTGGIGLVVSKNQNDQTSSGDIDLGVSNTFINTCGVPFNDAYSYNYNTYNIVSGDNKLVSDTTITYDQLNPAKSLIAVTNYTYDDLTHLQVVKSQSINSKGQTILSSKGYSYNNTAMNANHIWDKVLFDTTTNNGTQLGLIATTYNSFTGNNLLPSNIQQQVLTNPIEIRALFNSYDIKGHILEMQKSSDVKQSYIWDYAKIYPVAQAMNAGQADIAYTSFESDGTGGWSGINAAKINELNSITGKRSYTDNFTFSKTISSPGSYIISYWSLNGSYSVNGLTATALRSVGSWSYYEHSVTVAASGSITISGNGTIDELRLYPSTAQMITYTYDPLIGPTSLSDLNGRIIYYSYDPFQRLSLVRDDNKNILKKIAYSYKSLTDNSALYPNNLQTGSYGRSNCGAGYQGSQVTFTVQAGIYYGPTQASSDALALNELNTNGPGYANLNGSCTAVATIVGNNSKSISYSVKFTDVNNASSIYTLSLPIGANSLNLGQIPLGTYTVQFQPNGNPPLANFSINSYSMTNVTGATFNNVLINSTSTATVN